MQSEGNFLNTEHMNAFTADLTHRAPLCWAGAALNRLIQTTQQFTSQKKTNTESPLDSNTVNLEEKPQAISQAITNA